MADEKTLLELVIENAEGGKKGQRRERSAPLPDAVRPGKKAWTVRESQILGAVDLKKKEMIAPFGDSPIALRVRAHEMGHVAITPEDANVEELSRTMGVPADLFQGMEDARIHGRYAKDETLSEMTNVPFLDEAGMEKMKAQTLMSVATKSQRVRQLTAAGLYFAAAKTPEEQPMREVAEAVGLDRKLLEEYADRLAEASFDEMTQLAKSFYETILEQNAPKPPPCPGEGKPTPGKGEPGEGDSKSSKGKGSKWDKAEPLEKPPAKNTKAPEKKPPPEPLTPEEQEEIRRDTRMVNQTREALTPTPPPPSKPEGLDIQRVISAQAQRLKQRTRRWENRTATPGRMELLEPQRTVKVRVKKAKRKERREFSATDRGGSVGQLHRLYSDSKALRRKRIVKKREPKGSVLVDLSGSMGLDPREVERVLEKAPMATIAVYSGMGGVGTVRLLARDGKRVPDLLQEIQSQQEWGSNVIDVPALEWLEQQPEPRFWVSDGLATGIRDERGMNIIEMTIAICERGEIIRLAAIGDLLRKGTGVLERCE